MLLVLVVPLASEGKELVKLNELKLVDGIVNEVTVVEVSVLVLGRSKMKVSVVVTVTVPVVTVFVLVAG